MKKLTEEDVCALRTLAAEHGRYWKHARRESWLISGEHIADNELRTQP